MRRRAALGLAVGLGLLVAAGAPIARAGGFAAWILEHMTPDAPFGAQEPPPAPDSAAPGAWSARPELDDLADRAPPGLAAVAPEAARMDVFYVHPTSSIARVWNAPADDPALAAATDRGGALIQASGFNGVGAVWAPRDRQAAGVAFQRPSADGDAAIALAYSDVERAFARFVERRPPGRPFAVVGHSQGAALAARLVARRVAGTPLQAELVAAWIVGSGLTHEQLAREAPAMRACAGPDDTGCVIGWNARSPDHVPGGVEVAWPAGERRICTNPLTGVGEGGAAPAAANLGAVFLQHGDPAPRPGFADAACVDGTLRVQVHGQIPRDLLSRVLDAVMGKGNYHPVDFELFWSNVRADAARRVAAWERGRADGRGAAEAVPPGEQPPG